MREEITGREIKKQITIKADGTFGAISKAQEQIRKEGFAIGSMCRDEPIGFAPKDYFIAKWRNIRSIEYKKLSGIITSRDFREGDVTIIYFKKEE